MSAVVWLAPPAQAVEPCYGWTLPNVADGPRISVEYDDRVDADGARRILAAGEEALEVYAELGAPAPVGNPSISVDTDALGRFGFASTELCGDEYHSKLFVFEGALSPDGGEGTTAHELFHAVQYGYDPGFVYTDHFAVWPWWIEGTANWAEAQVYPERDGHFPALARYLDFGHLELHQDVTALIDPERQLFYYATSMVAFTLADRQGPEIIADTLEVGARAPGQPVWFPDVLAELGLDFDAFWADHLARLPTVDHVFGADLGVQPPVASTLRDLPGTLEPDLDRLPQGLGWSMHRIRPDVPEGTALTVRFTGDEGPRWHVAIVTARRDRPGAPHTPVFTETTEGSSPLEATVDYADPLWVVVSPEIDSDDGQVYRIRVTDPTAAASSAACGCASGPGAPAGGLLSLVALGWWFRRRPSR